METVVEQVAFGGKGLVRLPQGKVCFVPWVIPGETVEIDIRRDRSTYAEADLRAVVVPSPDRVDPPCPVFRRCGGCQYQHIAYDRQVAIKSDQVRDVLKRLGGIEDAPVEPTVPSPQSYAYRNRITVHAHKGQIGFFEAGSRRVVDVAHCPIASEPVNELLCSLRESNPADGEYPLREASTFRGFRQVNDGAAALLAAQVLAAAAPGAPLLVDAYCGAGFFARILRDLFPQIIGIEWSADAVRAARESARENETYLMGDVGEHLGAALAAGAPDDTLLLLDPPSEGITQPIIDAIVSRPPARLLYVSCNPGTLARDLRRLRPTYRLAKVTPVDMFPQTAEVEVLAVLERA